MSQFKNTKPRMFIKDGKIKMSDGTSLKKYLKQWQESANVAEGESVHIMTTKQRDNVNDAAILAENWGS